MRRQHTGRDGSTVIHPDWATAPRVAAESTHTAACSIRHPGVQPGKAFDPVTGKYTQVANAAHYTGPCGFERVTPTETNPVAGDEVVPTVEYAVAVAVDAAGQVKTGDLVTITDPGVHGDPADAGKVLTVESIDRSSLAWERILRCSENQS